MSARENGSAHPPQEKRGSRRGDRRPVSARPWLDASCPERGRRSRRAGPGWRRSGTAGRMARLRGGTQQRHGAVRRTRRERGRSEAAPDIPRRVCADACRFIAEWRPIAAPRVARGRDRRGARPGSGARRRRPDHPAPLRNRAGLRWCWRGSRPNIAFPQNGRDRPVRSGRRRGRRLPRMPTRLNSDDPRRTEQRSGCRAGRGGPGEGLKHLEPIPARAKLAELREDTGSGVWRAAAGSGVHGGRPTRELAAPTG